MSYYGLRKVKTYQDENGKWNFSCDCYDSSIWSWDNTRVWEHLDKWFKDGLETKEELEMYLFKNTLDGNLHGTSGKYNCLSWNSNKIQLTAKEKQVLADLEEKRNSIRYSEQKKLITAKLQQAKIPYEEWKNNAEYKAIADLEEKYSEEYNALRYDMYYRRWQAYLKQQNENRKGNTYVVRLDFSKNGQKYTGIYVKGIGSMTTTFTYYDYKAKLFKKSIEELKELFGNNPHYTNVEFINVSNYIKGASRRKYAEFEKVQSLDIVKC